MEKETKKEASESYKSREEKGLSESSVYHSEQEVATLRLFGRLILFSIYCVLSFLATVFVSLFIMTREYTKIVRMGWMQSRGWVSKKPKQKTEASVDIPKFGIFSGKEGKS